MVDLGTFGGPIGFAAAVSTSGQVVGSNATATGEWHAFSWTPAGGMVEMGTLGGMNSFAFTLSDAGQVVGQSDTPSGFQQGFLWTPSGGMVSLATLPDTSSEAVAINAHGQIAGSRGVARSTSPDDETHAMLWELSPAFVTVNIDIKPGSSENTINLHSHGVVPVAILSDASFDATHVDPSTVTLADAPVRIKGNGQWMAEVRDVNGDGRPDLVVKVETDVLTLAASAVTATLKGRTEAGVNIQGSDIVRLIP
jgi:probable HAF family extracellular repeat protein